MKTGLPLEGRAASPGEKADVFDTGRPAEHVHRLNLPDFISGFPEQRGVPRLGCHITGNINNTGGAGFCDRADNCGIQAFPGRILQHGVTAEAFPDQPGQELFRRAGMENRVGNPVAFRVAAGVFHRGRDDLDAHGRSAPGSGGQGDGSGAAVNVADGFIRLQVRKIQRRRIELFGLDRIDLEKADGESSNRRPQSVSGRVSFPYII